MSTARPLGRAYCGLDCTACDEYRATRSGDVVALEAAWQRWGHRSLAGTLCDGCRGGGRLADTCSGCAVRTCAMARGVPTCGACPEYACEPLEALLRRTPAAREALERLRRG